MGTHFKGTKAEVRALNAYIKLSRAYDSITSELRQSLSRENLTLSQLGVLEVLLHMGVLSQYEIGQKLLKSGGNVTHVINNLEKRNLVARKADESDRRAFQVSLTPAGKTLIKRIFPGHVKNIMATFGGLKAGELDDLSKLCKKLGVAL